jgi:hypothetical protein
MTSGRSKPWPPVRSHLTQSHISGLAEHIDTAAAQIGSRPRAYRYALQANLSIAAVMSYELREHIAGGLEHVPVLRTIKTALSTPRIAPKPQNLSSGCYNFGLLRTQMSLACGFSI